MLMKYPQYIEIKEGVDKGWQGKLSSCGKFYYSECIRNKFNDSYDEDKFLLNEYETYSIYYLNNYNVEWKESNIDNYLKFIVSEEFDKEIEEYKLEIEKLIIKKEKFIEYYKRK